MNGRPINGRQGDVWGSRPLWRDFDRAEAAGGGGGGSSSGGGPGPSCLMALLVLAGRLAMLSAVVGLVLLIIALEPPT